MIELHLDADSLRGFLCCAQASDDDKEKSQEEATAYCEIQLTLLREVSRHTGNVLAAMYGFRHRDESRQDLAQVAVPLSEYEI